MRIERHTLAGRNRFALMLRAAHKADYEVMLDLTMKACQRQKEARALREYRTWNRSYNRALTRALTRSYRNADRQS